MFAQSPVAATLRRRVGKLGLVVPAAFLYNAGTGLVNFAAVFYLSDRFNVGPAVVGLFAGVWNAAYLIGCVALKSALGRMRPRYAMLVSAVGMTIALSAMLAARSLPLAFLCYGAAGLLIALYWPPLAGWVTAGLNHAKLARATGIFNLSWSVANIASPFLAGLLVESSLAFPIAVAILAFLLVNVLIVASLLVSPETAPTAAETAAPAEVNSEDTPLRFPAWVGLFASYTFLGLLLNVFPLYARNELDLGEAVIGSILLTRALAMTGAFFFFARTRFWHFRIGPMMAGQALLAAAALMMIWSTTPWHFSVLLVIAGLALSLVYNQSLFHGMAGSTDRSGRMAIHEAVLTAGMIVGAVVGGFVYEHASMALLLAGFSILAGLGAGAQWYLHRNSTA